MRKSSSKYFSRNAHTFRIKQVRFQGVYSGYEILYNTFLYVRVCGSEYIFFLCILYMRNYYRTLNFRVVLHKNKLLSNKKRVTILEYLLLAELKKRRGGYLYAQMSKVRPEIIFAIFFEIMKMNVLVKTFLVVSIK